MIWVVCRLGFRGLAGLFGPSWDWYNIILFVCGFRCLRFGFWGCVASG